MARGGIYDQIGGGFARYAVDAIWLVPHFEKMLYDNALLARLGVHIWQATKDDEILRVTRETLDWALREMRSPEGGFYSSLDADSEGDEGKFYLWTLAEIEAALGADAPLAAAYWGVSEEGNFEGKNILHVPNEMMAVATRQDVSIDALRDTVARARRQLYDVRSRRVWPARDEKVLASWNGLMVRALAEASRAFDDATYREQALATGDFLFRALVRDGRALRSYKGGIARIGGYLEDHAALGLAALALYELTFDGRWLERATSLADAAVRWFWDERAGAFFDDPAATDFRALARAAAERYVPSLVVAGGLPERSLEIALLTDRPTQDGRATAYVCRDYACDAPVTDAASLGQQLDAAMGGRSQPG